MQTKNYKVFCPTKQTRIVAKKTAYNHQKIPKKSATILVMFIKRTLDLYLFGRTEILVIFGLRFGRNDDLINSF